MKRDMELIRKILNKIKECSTPYGLDNIPQIDGYSNQQISYHIKILCDAGLVDATQSEEFGAEYDDFFSINLTWPGQDFIDAAGDDTIWDKAKETIIKPGASFTFDLVLEFLKAKAKEKIGLL